MERRCPPAGVPAARAALAPGSPAQRQPGGPRPPAPSILHLPPSCELSVGPFHRAGTPGPEGLSPRRRSLVVLNACERGPSLQVRLRGTRDTVGLDHLGRGGRGRGQRRRKPSFSGRGWWGGAWGQGPRRGRGSGLGGVSHEGCSTASENRQDLGTLVSQTGAVGWEDKRAGSGPPDPLGI